MSRVVEIYITCDVNEDNREKLLVGETSVAGRVRLADAGWVFQLDPRTNRRTDVCPDCARLGT